MSFYHFYIIIIIIIDSLNIVRFLNMYLSFKTSLGFPDWIWNILCDFESEEKRHYSLNFCTTINIVNDTDFALFSRSCCPTYSMISCAWICYVVNINELHWPLTVSDALSFSFKWVPLTISITIVSSLLCNDYLHHYFQL